MNAASNLGVNRITVGVFAILLTGTAAANDAQTVQRAVDQALQGVSGQITKSDASRVDNVAVIPLAGDTSGYVTERVRDLVAQSPYSLFTARQDPVWDELLSEIEWGVRREDVMNPETVQRFGKIEGVDAIMYGRVWDSSVNLWSVRGSAKVSLMLADVETGNTLWRSGPLEGEAFIHWSDALVNFWRYPALLVITILLAIIVVLGLRSLRKAYKPI
jgi:hypothetical protein